MSLVLLYRDCLVADRRSLLTDPHAAGQAVEVKKIHVYKDRTFAIGLVGRTMSNQEMDVLGEIVKTTLKNQGKDLRAKQKIELEFRSWFASRQTISFLVMTKHGDYRYRRGDRKTREYVLDNERVVLFPTLIAVDTTHYPACYGSGEHAASIAAMEVDDMRHVVPLVASVTNTVSETYDIVYRRQLKVFK